MVLQSTPIPISVFGRPLLSGGFSGQGVSSPDKALAPLRVVAADGREWGLESPGAIIDVGEEIGEAGQRKTKVQFELLEYCFFYGMIFFNGMKMKIILSKQNLFKT